jgi:flagellar motor switch protein FliN/FliY
MDSVEEGRRWLVDEFVSAFSLALGGMLGEKPAISKSALSAQAAGRGLQRSISSTDLAAPGESVVRESMESSEGRQLFWKQPFSNGVSGWLGGPEAVWMEVGVKTLTAAGIDDADPSTAKSTFVEILNQAFSALTRSISNWTKHEIACGAGSEADSAPDGLAWVGLEISIGSEVPAQVQIAFEDELAQTIGATAAADIMDQESQARPAPARTAPRPAGTPNTLDLLLDVELPVSVSFGRSQLPLKDVIKLTTGSIIELNRSISEPVEIIVNNCVIARGEVVVVEGNFGVRIHEVISRQERLRTLY